MSKVHIGTKIREVLRQSDLTVTAFAAAINVTRDAVYKIFRKDVIDTGNLRKISKTLNHDFFKYFSEELPVVSDPYERMGFVTKDEFEQLKSYLESVIRKEMTRLREELSIEKSAYQTKRPVRKNKR